MNQATELIARQMAAGANIAKIWGDILYNVKAYGAKGDGTTDDTATIQAAIDAAPDGGIIYFPQGVYITSKPIVIKRGQRLVGPDGAMAVIGGSPLTYGAKGAVIKKITTTGKAGLTSYSRTALVDLSSINAIIIICTPEYDYESVACSIENIGLDCDTNIAAESRPTGIYLFRAVTSKFSNINMHNVYRGIDGDDYYLNEYSKIQVFNAVDCGFVLKATSNNLKSCFVTGARVGYYLTGSYHHLDNCAADQIVDIAYWTKDAEAVKLTNCGQEMCTGNKFRFDTSDSVTVDTALASGNSTSQSQIVPNYSGVGITTGLAAGQREYTIAVNLSNVVFLNSLIRLDATKGTANRQELISDDSNVNYFNTVIGRSTNSATDFIPTVQSAGMAKNGRQFHMFWTDGVTDIDIGSCRRIVFGPFIYVLGIIYPGSIAAGNDSKQFILKFRDEYGIYGAGFPDPGIVTDAPGQWEPTAFGSHYMPIQLVSGVNVTGQPKIGGIDPRDNRIYFYDTDSTQLTVAEAKTLAVSGGGSLRFYGFHLMYLGA